MLKEQSGFFRKISIFADILALVASFLLACQFEIMQARHRHFTDLLWMLLVIIPVWYAFLHRNGIYQSLRTKTAFKVTASLVKAHLMAGITTAALIYMFAPTGSSRTVLASFLALSIVALALEKMAIKIALGIIRRRGFNYRNILVACANENANLFLNAVKRHGEWGLRVVGVLLPDAEPDKHVFEGYNVLGSFEDLVSVCRFYAVDEVAFCIKRPGEIEMSGYIGMMEEMGITTRIVFDIYDSPNSTQEIGMFNEEVPMLTFHPKFHEAGKLIMKRCLDIAGATLGLLFVAVTFPLIAAAIKLESKGPIFFGQKRSGMNGRIFKCWKFRSMYMDAENRKQELMHLNEMSGALFKIKNDPRITRVGRFLRKTSLDEIPQFWNVLKGEMSLVGTRPPTPDEVVNYTNCQRKRICIKPGITGLWQVSGRNSIKDFDEVVRLDLEYIEQWSLELDLRILFRTIRVVFARHGSF